MNGGSGRRPPARMGAGYRQQSPGYEGIPAGACTLPSKETRRQTTSLRRYIVVMLLFLVVAHLLLLFNAPALLKQAF